MKKDIKDIRITITANVAEVTEDVLETLSLRFGLDREQMKVIKSAPDGSTVEIEAYSPSSLPLRARKAQVETVGASFCIDHELFAEFSEVNLVKFVENALAYRLGKECLKHATSNADSLDDGHPTVKASVQLLDPCEPTGTKQLEQILSDLEMDKA